MNITICKKGGKETSRNWTLVNRPCYPQPRMKMSHKKSFSTCDWNLTLNKQHEKGTARQVKHTCSGKYWSQSLKSSLPLSLSFSPSPVEKLNKILFSKSIVPRSSLHLLKKIFFYVTSSLFQLSMSDSVQQCVNSIGAFVDLKLALVTPYKLPIKHRNLAVSHSKINRPRVGVTGELGSMKVCLAVRLHYPSG